MDLTSFARNLGINLSGWQLNQERQQRARDRCRAEHPFSRRCQIASAASSVPSQ